MSVNFNKEFSSSSEKETDLLGDLRYTGVVSREPDLSDDIGDGGIPLRVRSRCTA